MCIIRSIILWEGVRREKNEWHLNLFLHFICVYRKKVVTLQRENAYEDEKRDKTFVWLALFGAIVWLVGGRYGRL